MHMFPIAAVTAVALVFTTSQAHAVSIAIDESSGDVTLSGTLVWTQIEGGSGGFGASDYTLRLPLADSPFAADFTPPDPDEVVPLSPTARLSVGAPLFQPFSGTRSFFNLQTAFTASSTPVGAPLSDQLLRFQDVTSIFPQGSLDGDYTYQFIVNFDETFETITSVVSFLRVRTPLIQTDFFDTDVYFGVDALSAALPGAGATPGGMTPVPLPASGLLLAAGLLGMAGAGRARRA